MKTMYACILAFLALGCGGGSQANVEKPEPLTVKQWAVLPAETKYVVDTLERVKAGDPKFQNEEEWDRFTRRVIVPAKNKDLAAGKLPR